MSLRNALRLMGSPIFHEAPVAKHMLGEHDQRDHAPHRSGLMRDWLKNVVSPFFFNQPKGKHHAPPAINWWTVFDDQMESAHDNPKSLRGPIKINDTGAYFVPLSVDPDSGDGYFFTSSGKRLWGRYGAAGVMVRSRNDDGVPVYMLARRSQHISGGGGTWAVPGGALDKGETPGHGALRELDEEVGAPPTGSGYKIVAADRNEIEDGWAYTTVLAEIDKPYQAEAKDWETSKEEIGWFTEPEIKQMNLHPAMQERIDAIFDLWHSKKGGAHAAPEQRDVMFERSSVTAKRVDMTTPVNLRDAAEPHAPGDEPYFGTDQNPDFATRLGNCYELSGMAAVLGAPEGSKLVHGTIQGFGNPPLGHGWVELPDGNVWEPISHTVWERDLFYAFHNATADRTYDQTEVRVHILKEKNWGPWHPVDERGVPVGDVTKHLPGLHNQKSHGHRGGGVAPWLLDGGGFLNENEWNLHKWAYTHNIEGYTGKYDKWHEQTYGEKYLPWDAPDPKQKPPKGAPKPDAPEPTAPAGNADDWVDQVMGQPGGPVKPDTSHPTKPKGAGSAKVGYEVLPGLTLYDMREDAKDAPLNVDSEKLATILGIDDIPKDAKIKLSLRTAKPGMPYGSTMKVGEDEFDVRVNVLPLAKVKTDHPPGVFPDDALYVINNSLVHELRHVGQHYVYPNMDTDYAAEMVKHNYDGNFYEVEAWLWGHYADQTGKKNLTTDKYPGKVFVLGGGETPAEPLGYKVWALTPPGWKEPT